MRICHVCKCECGDYAELCHLCGADLTVSIEENESVEEKVIERPVLLATLDDVVSAEILRDILNSNGIPNSGSESGDGAMKVAFGGAFVAEEIYVDSCDFEKAEELYQEFLNSEVEFEGEFFVEEEEN